MSVAVREPEVVVEQVLALQNGDRLRRDEFERRYSAMPEVKKAELIEGEVFMPSPVRNTVHGDPHSCLITWLGVYRAATKGVQTSDNATVRLDWDNVFQPDALLRVMPACGGQSRDEDDFIAGPPELVAEVSASTTSIDMNQKLEIYRRSGVKQYIVWRVLDGAIDWLVHRGGEYEPRAAKEGVYKSTVFPGLWLDTTALLTGDMAKVLATLQQGTAGEEHAKFQQILQRGLT